VKKSFFVRHVVRGLFAGALALNVCASQARAEEPAPVALGISRVEADRYNAEFQLYDRVLPVYREHGIRAALVDLLPFYSRDCSEEKLLEKLKQFHVVQLTTPDGGVKTFDAIHRKRASLVGRALLRYVEQGGGLCLQPQAVRYRGDEDELYWNAVIAPLGAKILHEGDFDKTRRFEGQTLQKATFWYTRNIQPHPVTEGVGCLCLPLHGYDEFPGTVAMQYGPEWQILVRGEKEAKSYRSNVENVVDLDAEGTYAQSPPVLAVRSLGRGRVVCYPLTALFTGLNHRNPLWADIVESAGDRSAHRPSDSMKMQINAYRWLAEPSRGLADYGTYVLPPYQPAQFPDRAQYDHHFPYPPAAGIRGMMGAHSAYSDGTGSVADYVKAAKAAGLSFIVFADPLEKLTREALGKLKTDCAAAAAGDDFYACPGIEFTDGIGNRWAFCGESIVWPDASFRGRNGVSYTQWDGKRVHHYGQFVCACQFCDSALLSYREFRNNGGHPENLWAFFNYLPLVYDKDRLIADNQSEYLFGLRDLRWAAISSFTRVRSPADVAAAAGACFTGMRDLPLTKALLNHRAATYGLACQANQYVSQGPVIAAWQEINAGMGNWRYTRGAQRVRLNFVVRSEAGIAEVKILDADRGPIRRFLGHGAKEFTRQFELAHDQQRYLVLEVTDAAGKKAISHDIFVYCYKSGLYRCGDNCNILGPTAMVWHPDRNQFFNAAKDFRNGADYCLRGWDTGSAALGVPTPNAYLATMINVKEAGGWYPQFSKRGMVPGCLMDVGINNYDLQIATMRMTKLSETCNTRERPSPYLASVPRNVGDLEYFERTHTLYAPMERVDMFVSWDYRRDREGRKDYRGGILWHEGEFRFKKDCTLQRAVPIPLFNDLCPTDLAMNLGTHCAVTDADGPTRNGRLGDQKKPVAMQGRIRPGGYAALMGTPVGYHGLLVPADMDFAYQASLRAGQSSLSVGLGRDGQQVKAGTVLKYRFGVATFVDPAPDNSLLEHTVKAMNLGGGHAGYPVEMATGEVEDATFFFTARAVENEAAFTLGPQALIIDLPIRVRGLEDNGCAAIYSSQRPWFRFVPVDPTGTAWLQEPIDAANKIWVGNVLACDNKAVKITLVVDGQAKGKLPFVELHNPTDQEIVTRLHAPSHAPLFGGISTSVTLPPGDSQRLTIDGKAFKPWVTNP
jgi:hypothetical protein